MRCTIASRLSCYVAPPRWAPYATLRPADAPSRSYIFSCLPAVFVSLCCTPSLSLVSLIHQNAYPAQHSLGVAYLAGRWVSQFRVLQPQLNITNRDVLCVTVSQLHTNTYSFAHSLLLLLRSVALHDLPGHPEVSSRCPFCLLSQIISFALVDFSDLFAWIHASGSIFRVIR